MNVTGRIPSIAISAQSAMPTDQHINVRAAVSAGHIGHQSATTIERMSESYNEALHRLFWSEAVEDQELAWEDMHRLAHGVYPALKPDLVALAGGQRIPAGLSAVRSFDDVMSIGMTGSQLLMYLAHHHPLTVFLKNYLIFAAANVTLDRGQVPPALATTDLDQLLRLAASFTEIQSAANKAVTSLTKVLDAGQEGVAASAIPHTIMLMSALAWASGCSSQLMDNAMSLPALAAMRTAKSLPTEFDGNQMTPLIVAANTAGRPILVAGPWMAEFLEAQSATVSTDATTFSPASAEAA